MNTLTHLSLFSGIGGLDLAAEWAGFQTVGQCEWNPYAQKVLNKHWTGIYRWGDIRTLTGSDFYARTGLRTVTVLSGGFPCQPFSVAGKRRGTKDDRYLWPEMLRVISEIRPTWVLGENVPGIVNMALDTVCADLEAQGYEVQPFNIPAAGVDAPHKRARICIIGNRTHTLENSDSIGCIEPRNVCEQPGRTEFERYGEAISHTNRNSSDSWRAEPTGQQRQTGASNGRNDVADTESTELQGKRRETRERRAEFRCGGWWPAEPDVGRVANGIPSRVDRLKCLGNAVVPQQFYPFFKWIAELEAIA